MRLTVVSAGTLAAPMGAFSCSSDDDPEPVAVFGHGLASGDPKPNSVILWTRAVNPEGGAHEVTYEVATDEAFAEPVASGTLTVSEESDFTLRIKLTDLSPATFYYYRFAAAGETTVVGRTKTAPAEDADTPVRFAFASCQDRNGRYYHAWRALLDEAATNDIDFVLFLGDYIYETEGDPRFQDPTDERKTTVTDGIEIGDAEAPYKAALTLTDYRGLYQQYRTDADLQAVHARFPFVMLWDDHEFADDCWQDHSTHFNGEQGEEQNTSRRADATQAWFEYMPVDVEYDAAASPPNDIAIYRQLRFGQHAELVITDQRYYRSDHAVPEGPQNVQTGKIDENSAIGARSFVRKSGFDPIEASSGATMLGATQKTWFIDAMTSSTATFKVWANETQLAQMLVDLTDVEGLGSFADVFYFTCDQWDGYRTERAEVLAALEPLDNVIALTGDIHAFYASELFVDFDMPSMTPAAVEYVTSGISSSPVQEITTKTIETSETLTELNLLPIVGEFNQRLQTASPHYKHAASNVNGVSVATVTGTSFRVDFIEVGDVKNPEDAGEKNRVSFETPAGQKVINPV